MARFRLRHQATNLEMPMGEFSIGRSASCNLALADGLVSRRHAILHVRPDAVVVEDLGSRNGVAVNGVRVDGPRTLSHLDRVYIGSQELVLVDTEQLHSGTQETQGYRQCIDCGAINGSAKRRCGECGSILGPAATQAQGSLRSANGASRQSSMETQKARALDVIGGIASKAIAMGRYEEAERMLIPHLDALLESAKKGGSVAQDDEDQDVVLAAAASFALQLAKGLQRNRWIDWVFRVHAETGALMEQTTIEALHNLVRKNRYARLEPLRHYLGAIHANAGSHSASERFLVRRLQGLEDVISAS